MPLMKQTTQTTVNERNCLNNLGGMNGSFDFVKHSQTPKTNQSEKPRISGTRVFAEDHGYLLPPKLSPTRDKTPAAVKSSRPTKSNC